MKNNNYDADFFVLRTPLKPFNKIIELFQTVKTNRGKFTANLKELFKDPVLIEAIYLASPTLYYDLIKFLTSSSEYENLKVEKSLIKYYSRICTRCTPFGIFSGCSIGKFSQGDRTVLKIKNSKAIKKHLRLDMDFMCNLAQLIISENHVKEQSIFYPNTSFYKIFNEFRYVEYSYINNRRSHKILSIDLNSILNKVIAKTKTGLKFEEIVQVVYKEYPNLEECKMFVLNLIDSQILLSEFSVNVTGDEYLTRFASLLGKYSPDSKLHKLFKDLLSQSKENISLTSLHRFREGLIELKIPFREDKLFQIDMTRSSDELFISEDLKERFLETVDVLATLNTAHNHGTKLEQFKRSFFEKYEYELVPLSTALDTEIGIGYINEYSLKDYYGIKESKNDAEILEYKKEKLKFSREKNLKEIVLTSEEINPLRKSYKLPSAFSVTLSVSKRDNNNYEFLFKGYAAPGSCNALGRFCHSDDELNNLVQTIIEKEEALEPDKIFAEIAHLPQSRIGNIISRPHLRKYEIPYLAHSTLPKNNQIEIEDLYLKHDGKNLSLISKRLNKEVLPRMATAHAYYYDSLPIYHFLCELGSQDTHRNIIWTWGDLSSEFFLPRVRYNNIILALATWNISEKHFLNFKILNGGDADECFKLYLKTYGIPAMANFVIRDNMILLDLDLKVCREILLTELKKGKTIVLEETFFNTKNLIVDSPDGMLANEIVVPFNSFREVSKKVNIRKTTPMRFAEKIKRVFPPGTEWVYFKIYCSKNTGEQILKGQLLKIKNKFLSSGICDQWHFVKYADPKTHIRVRFHLSDESKYGNLVQMVNKALQIEIKKGSITTIQVDTYKREIERYGSAIYEQTENIFFLSSEATLDILILIRGIDNLYTRYLCAMSLIRTIYEAFAVDFSEQLDFSTRALEGYKTEFNFDNSNDLRENFNKIYRELRPGIEDFLLSKNVKSPTLNKVDFVLNNLKVKITSQAKDLFLKDRSFTRYNLESYIWTHVHMTMNRFFLDDPRKMEMTVYYLYTKHLKSLNARHISKKG